MGDDAERVGRDQGFPMRDRVLIGVLVVLVGAIGVGLVVAHQKTSGPDPSELIGRDWQVDSVAIDGGSPVEMPADQGARIGFTAVRLDAEGCGQTNGEVTIGRGRMTFPSAFASTAMGCGGGAGETYGTALYQLATAGQATWTVHGDRLRIKGGGVVILAHEPSYEETFPPSKGTVLNRSEDGAFPQWRLSGDIAGLTLEFREEPATPFGVDGSGINKDPALFFEVLGGRLLPYGTLPDGTDHARFVPDGDAPTTELTIFHLSNGRPVFGQPVTGLHGAIEAYAADGTLLDTRSV